MTPFPGELDHTQDALSGDRSPRIQTLIYQQERQRLSLETQYINSILGLALETIPERFRLSGFIFELRQPLPQPGSVGTEIGTESCLVHPLVTDGSGPEPNLLALGGYYLQTAYPARTQINILQRFEELVVNWGAKSVKQNTKEYILYRKSLPDRRRLDSPWNKSVLEESFGNRQCSAIVLESGEAGFGRQEIDNCLDAFFAKELAIRVLIKKGLDRASGLK